MKLTILNYGFPFSEETRQSILGLHWNSDPEQPITEIEEIVVPCVVDLNGTGDESVSSLVWRLAQCRRELVRENPIAIKLPSTSDVAVQLYLAIVSYRYNSPQTFLMLKGSKESPTSLYALVFHSWYSGGAV